MIPYKVNPLGVSNKKSNNISSFKIQGDSLTSMYITPVEDCVVDFGDGTIIKKMQIGKWDINSSNIDFKTIIPKL